MRIRTTIGQGGLEMIPNAFIRIQLRRIGRKWNQDQTRCPAQKLADGLAPMGRAVIQHNDQQAVDLPQQMTEKRRHFFPLDVVFIQMAVERATTTFRTDGEAGNRRNAVVAIPVTNDRGVSHRTPCFSNRGNQEEARFVEKDDMGRQPSDVFFTLGQTDRFHSAMAASSRSTARRSGFWWLQPSSWRSLPT